jgi:adenylyltransferase/sulfurtransferase
MKEITVEELKKKLDQNDGPLLLDVRESFEVHISNIDTDTTLIPLDDLSNRMQELDQSAEIIVICRSGSRSGKACEMLEENGFSNVANLKGGMNEWALKIDPSLPQY